MNEKRSPSAGGTGARAENKSDERSSSSKSPSARQGHHDNVDPLFRKYAFAYLDMAKHARYRPAAPGDGFGGIYLNPDELRDRHRLRIEAIEYAIQFFREEESDAFIVGCANYSTAAAFMFAIEAARVLASGDDGNATALKLLRMAVAEITKARKARAA